MIKQILVNHITINNNQMEDYNTEHNRMVIMQAITILRQLNYRSSLGISDKLNKAIGMLGEIARSCEVKYL